jgi:cell wall-associated NlpC family hydrolase
LIPIAHPRPWILRLLALAAVAAVLLGSGLTSRSRGDLQSQISAARSAAGTLKQQIAADSAQIASTGNGLQNARDRLAAVQTQVDRRVAELRAVQISLIAARDHLVDLENRLHVATSSLAANLVAGYEGSTPDLVSVVLNSHGFGDLLEQVSYLQRIAHQDSKVVGLTRTARAEVAREATRLGGLEDRDRTLASQIIAQRNQAAALQSALLHQQAVQLAKRAKVSTRFHAVNSHLAALNARENAIEARAAAIEKRAEARAATAATTGNANVGGIAVDTGGMVHAPPGAPAAVAQVIAAGNAIATLPYIYGGGHASFHANGYDCSGSVSYALAAAGLVSSPMVSGDFEDWGSPGPGKWITLYANAGHVWMTVAGWRFDTVALAESGTRWARGGGEFDGMTVVHPTGL